LNDELKELDNASEGQEEVLKIDSDEEDNDRSAKIKSNVIKNSQIKGDDSD
jgi:hypothetical protein